MYSIFLYDADYNFVINASPSLQLNYAVLCVFSPLHTILIKYTNTSGNVKFKEESFSSMNSFARHCKIFQCTQNQHLCSLNR